MHVTPIVSVAEARQFLQALVDVEKSSADLNRVDDHLILQLYRETFGRRGCGKLVHKLERTFGSTPCVVTQMGLRPRHVNILLHGFASSPLHILPVVERYHTLMHQNHRSPPPYSADAAAAAEDDESSVAWVLPRGPIEVSSLNTECVYNPAAASRRSRPNLLSDSNLYCWWELNSDLRNRGTFRQIVRMIKNKLFNPINVQPVVREVAALIASVSETFKIPYYCITLTGFCQGATVVSEYLLLWHQNVATLSRKSIESGHAEAPVEPPLGGAALISGGPCRTAHDATKQSIRRNNTRSSVSATPVSGASSSAGDCDHTPTALSPSHVAEVPLFIAHGLRDTVVPYTMGRMLRRKMIGRGFDHTEFFPFKGGHEITDEVLEKLHKWTTSCACSRNNSGSCGGSKRDLNDNRFQRMLHPTRHHRTLTPTSTSADSSPIMPDNRSSTPLISPNLMFNWTDVPAKEAQFFAQLWLRLPRLPYSLILPSISIAADEPDELSLIRQITGYENMGILLQQAERMGDKVVDTPMVSRRRKLTRKLFSLHRSHHHKATDRDTSVGLSEDDESSGEGNDARLRYWLT